MQNLTLLRTGAYINGEFLLKTDRTFEVRNPANGKLIANVACCGAKETEAAIRAAKIAQQQWKRKTAKERSKILLKWFGLIMHNQEELAYLLSLEQGKPLAESRGEIAYGASFIEWFAEEGKRAYGEIIPQDKENRRLLVIKQPVGVVAAITPWNFPNAMIARKAAPALAAGCTFIVRPASQTPFSALGLAALAEQAGIPAGVFNVITGAARPIGKVLTEHPLVRKFSFTGSTETGRELMRQCAGSIKKVSLELGGNAPFIVFDDADIDAAVAGAVAAKFRNAGQTCVCANRIYVQRGVYDAFAAKFAAAAGSLKTGSGFDAASDLGPLIDDKAAAHTRELLADALENGGRVLCGGSGAGRFFDATVIGGANTQMRVAREEIFAPLAPLFVFDSEEEAVALANDTEYGLAAYFYSQNLARCVRVAEALEYGMVGVNTGIISNAAAPFGGVKQSGLGREGSKYGLDEYLETKYVALGGI